MENYSCNPPSCCFCKLWKRKTNDYYRDFTIFFITNNRMVDCI